MKKTLTRLFMVPFLAGAVAGPGYLLFVTHFSGKAVAKHELFSLDITPVSIQGVSTRVVKGEDTPIPPLSLQLTPEMNPVAILISGSYIPPLAGSPVTPYKVTLSRGNVLLWEDVVRVQGKVHQKKKKVSLSDVKIGRMGLDSFSFHVKTFSVSEAGTYDLVVTRTSEHSSLHVVNMNANLRRNVAIARKSVVLAGCGMLGVGLLGLVTIGILNKKSAK